MSIEDQLRALGDHLEEVQEPITADELRREAGADTHVDPSPPGQRRLLLIAAVVILIIAGVLSLVALSTDDEEPQQPLDSGAIPVPDPTAPATSTAPATTPAPATTVPATSTAVQASTPAPANTGAVGEQQSTDVAAPTGSEATWLVPWRDGFLAIASPDLSQPEPPQPTLRARFTTDGQDWTSIDLGWPPGLGEPVGVTTAGDRLFVLDQSRPVGSKLVLPDRQHVMWTDDLTNWETLELEPPAPPPDLPPTVEVDSYASTVVANDAGWIAHGVGRLSLSPEALLQGRELGSSFGWAQTDDGVRVVLDDTEYTVTWEELGIDEATRALLDSWDPDRSVIWTDDGQIVEFGYEELEDVVAADDGFYGWGNGRLRFSADGASWEAVPSPSGAVVEFAIGVAGEALAVLGPQWQIAAVDGPTGEWRTIDTPLPPASDVSDPSDQGSGVESNSGAYVVTAYDSERFVIASADGVEWLVEELPAPPTSRTHVALNGTTVLLLDRGTWTTFELP